MTGHSHPHHKLVIAVLERIARENKRSLSKIKNLFSVKGDLKITDQFWSIVNKQHAEHQFIRVWKCHGCSKFGMDEATNDQQYQVFLKSFKHQAE